ncbi:hypothetical protein OSB04_025013 [Centaurea solstitialis]|uniref:Reverse transcriptase domain-containing protein n=1 Tax=Centaurea solstitialis TaxID=347529 RepID=A0AA38SYY0_9ASTR|nr:hypothetical protein OSB04_025013 [Centaurea solstitialis]
MNVVSSSSEEQMFDQSLEEDSQKTTEDPLSFRPHSEKTISKGSLSFKEKKILLDIPIQQSYVETQTSNMRDLYNLSRTDSRYVDFSGIYPRINYLQGSSPQEIRHWYDFGAINSIYLTSPDFPEISELPHWILSGVRDCYLNNPTITPKDTLVLKFLSSGPDFYEENRYPAFHFIQLAESEAFSISITNKKTSFQKYCENDIHYRRALGIRIILQGMEAGFKKGFRTYGGNKIYSSVMISPAKITPRAAENYLRTKIDLLDKGAQHRICQYRGHTRGRCFSCSPSKDKETDEDCGAGICICKPDCYPKEYHQDLRLHRGRVISKDIITCIYEIARGKARMVINYKKLNDNTVFDGYFLPHKESLINWTTDKKIFSKFDCKSGFWQIKMHPDSILYTSFSTPQGQYEWLVMPFGLKNAPQIFQRIMDSIFKDYDFIFVYVDDVLILSDNIESHLKHLDIFIELCIKNGLALSEKKTKLIQEQIDFLGMKIDGKGIELQSHILEKINSFPDKLIDKKQVQSFLGILNYASDFIKNLALLRKPFQDLLKKNKVFSFDKSLENQVKKIKEYCKILPKLQLPKDNDDLILETDASENYWSGVLKKIDYNSEQEKIGESICRYCSGTFTDNQTRYHINEKELLAVVKSCQKLFYFLLPKKFLLRTDNTHVKAFIKNNLPSKPEYKRLIRWQTLLF